MLRWNMKNSLVEFLKKLNKYIKLLKRLGANQKIIDRLNFILTNGINKEQLSYEIERFSDYGINSQTRTPKIIVSLTSFPERMYDLHFCLYSLLKQSLKPDKIILWLAEEEFPERENDISQKVLKLKDNGLTIKWCNNIGSYKKLIPSLKEYSDDIIVTADDDIFYPPDWLEKLYNSYLKNPENIHCHRAHKITFDRNKNILPYERWTFCIDDNTCTAVNFPTTGGGVLYPPHSLYRDVLNKDIFMQLAPNADDIWFWSMCVLNNKKIKVVENPINDITYTNPQRAIGIYNEKILCNLNSCKIGGNDDQLKNVLEKYPHLLNIVLNSEVFNSADYWQNRYLNNGNSGAGSYGRLAKFKANIINSFAEENKIKSVIEFGCGDGNQLALFNFKQYLGFDVSDSAIELCRKKFMDNNNFVFKHLSQYNGEKAELCLSLDVIYHLIEDSVYDSYMKNLFNSAEKFVIIYSSNKNKKHCKHVKHRKFSDWIKYNCPEWELLKYIPNKYPYNKNDEDNTSFADFYIFVNRSMSSVKK